MPFGEGHDPIRIEPLRARIVFLTANLSGTGQARAEQDSVLRGGVAVIAITLAAGDNGRRGGGLGAENLMPKRAALGRLKLPPQGRFYPPRTEVVSDGLIGHL